LCKYIANQEEHHRKRTFNEEYELFCASSWAAVAGGRKPLERVSQTDRRECPSPFLKEGVNGRGSNWPHLKTKSDLQLKDRNLANAKA
jgi:hypothetical protein